MRKEKQTSEIKKFIIETLADGHSKVSTLVAKKFGISRQAINRYLNNMIRDGLLIAKGNTRKREYSLKTLVSVKFEFDITADPDLRDELTDSYDENRVWLKTIRPLLKNISLNVLDICQYGFTEMVNNVFDHSEATKLTIGVEHSVARVDLIVIDNGVGIFHKIQSALGLDDHLHAILELAKGKLTTDPEHHTGEGIFFTSRMFDALYVESGTLRFVHFKAGEDWLVEAPDKKRDGTAILMSIDPNSKRSAQEVFNRFSTELEDYGFTKTKVPVDLARYGDENLISRSQAKRLLARFDRFKEVILDFAKVETIGPAFADEIFRVFVTQHPDIKLLYANANNAVEKMIRRAKNQPK